jgi:hypothetical protein
MVGRLLPTQTMSALWVLAASLLAFGSSGGELTRDLDRCLSGLETENATHQARLPEFARRSAPALYSLERSIPVLRANFLTTAQWVDRNPGGAPQRHAVENAVVACQRFRERYHASSGTYFAFLAALGSLILVLTARVGLAMVPATSRRPDHETKSDSSPPSRSAGGF